MDPILGVLTGFLAYYLYETHPRTAMPEELRLKSLLRWKYTKWQKEREQKLLSTEDDVVDWQALAASAGVDDDSDMLYMEVWAEEGVDARAHAGAGMFGRKQRWRPRDGIMMKLV